MLTPSASPIWHPQEPLQERRLDDKDDTILVEDLVVPRTNAVSEPASGDKVVEFTELKTMSAKSSAKPLSLSGRLSGWRAPGGLSGSKAVRAKDHLPAESA